MANSIRITANLTYSGNGLTLTGNGSNTLTQTGNEATGFVQTIGTTFEQLTFTDLGDVRYLYLKNQDETNYVEVSTDNAGTKIFAKLLAGDFLLVPPSTATLYARANTAAIPLQIVAAET